MEGDSPFLFCDICNVQSSSDNQHRSHLLGKRHWHNKRLKEEAQRSVYVRGFPSDSPTVTKEELADVFKSFGSVHKIVTDPKNVFAIVEFANVDSALSVLHHKQPLSLRDTPLTVRPREFKIKTTRKADKDDSDSGRAHEQDEQDSLETSVEESGHEDILRKKYKLKDEAIEDIRRHPYFEKQMEAVITHLQLHDQDVHYRVMILGKLQSIFSTVFPTAHVMPIGSLSTGLSTPSSDIDAVLITDWNDTDQKYFGYDFFLQERTLASYSRSPLGKEVEEEMEVSSSDNPFSSATPPISESLTQFSLPPGIKVIGDIDTSDCSKEYKMALCVIGRTPGFCKILAITTARCPIIRFTDSATGINCDLSINNRFGVYNSKLLRAYVTFDARLVSLLFVLRVWLLSAGIKPCNLNNYTITLMLIYFLQRTTPPVVPNLQNVGPWPRNMEWIGHQGVMCKGDSEVIDMTIDGWRCKMMDNRSLAYSTNRLTSVELLRDFFNFYGSHFSLSTHAVSVHTPASSVTTIEEACRMASEGASPEMPEKYKKFKVTSLCVQDPVELGHNVAKTLSPKLLEVLKTAMQVSCVRVDNLLQSTDISILSLFGYEQPLSPLQSPVKLVKCRQILSFTKENISKLFSMVSHLSDLSCHIQSMNTASLYVKRKLGILVLRALLCILEKDLGFSCFPVTESKVAELLPSLMLNPSERTNRQVRDDANMKSFLLMKRQRESEEEEKRLKKEAEKDSGVDYSVAEGQLKRVRLETDTPSLIAMLESRCLMKDDNRVFPNTVQCTAAVNTWVHRRRMKRQQQQLQEVGQPSATPNPPPILQFTMTSTDSLADTHALDVKEATVWIEISLGNNAADMIDEFQTFYAFFKKLVVS